MSGPGTRVPVPIGNPGGVNMTVLPRPCSLAEPKKMTLLLYINIPGPISCMTGSTILTGKGPSFFQVLAEMMYFSDWNGSQHWVVTIVLSGKSTQPSSFDRTALLAAGVHELEPGS